MRNGRGRTKAGWRSLHFDLQLFCNSLIPTEEPLELVGDSRSVTDVPGSSSIYLSGVSILDYNWENECISKRP